SDPIEDTAGLWVLSGLCGQTSEHVVVAGWWAADGRGAGDGAGGVHALLLPRPAVRAARHGFPRPVYDPARARLGGAAALAMELAAAVDAVPGARQAARRRSAGGGVLPAQLAAAPAPLPARLQFLARRPSR